MTASAPVLTGDSAHGQGRRGTRTVREKTRGAVGRSRRVQTNRSWAGDQLPKPTGAPSQQQGCVGRDEIRKALSHSSWKRALRSTAPDELAPLVVVQRVTLRRRHRPGPLRQHQPHADGGRRRKRRTRADPFGRRRSCPRPPSAPPAMAPEPSTHLTPGRRLCADPRHAAAATKRKPASGHRFHIKIDGGLMDETAALLRVPKKKKPRLPGLFLG
jgi:hypothetical protein